MGPDLRRAWFLVVALSASSLLLYTVWVRNLGGGPSRAFLPWWVLAFGFFLAESRVLDLPFRHYSHQFSLSELPLTIGLFLLDPPLLVLTALIGVLPALAIARRQRGLKLLFNMTMLALEVNVACLVFHWLSQGGGPLEPRSWLAGFGSAVIACLTSNVAVTLVVSLVEKEWRLSSLVTDTSIAAVTGTTNACLAILGVAVIEINPIGVVLLLIPGAVLMFAYYNIIQRRQAELQLRNSELRFRTLVQNSADVVAVTDTSGLIGYVTPSIARVLGYEPDRLIRKGFFDIIHPEDRPAAEEAMSRVVREPGAIETFSARAVAADGSIRWLESTLHNLTHDPTIEAIVSNVRDVTEKKRAEEEVRESEERLQSILDHANAGVFIKDLDGRYQLVNRRIEEIHQRAKYDILGRTDHDLWPPEVAETLRANDREVIETLTPTSTEEVIRNHEGTRTYLSIRFPMFDAEGNVSGLCAIATDVTESKRIEERLTQSEKMQAVGQLAGGIAHDFNNLLAIIQNYARFIIDDLPADSPIRQDAEEIEKAGETAASLTRQLLAFSRKEIYQPNVVDLNEVVVRTCKMLRPALAANIDLDLQLEDDLEAVRIDTGRMEQVIMNLAINARDAMDGDGGLAISTDNVAVGAEGERYVALRVADNGAGIPDDVLPHIFEPFFTTKSREQGTGLGLASVYGIVQESGGHIDVESVVGRGTTFSVYLPACGDSVDTAAEHRELPSGDGYRILIAEDERGVRNIAERILVEHGYDVIAVSSGREAFEIWESPTVDIDLLLADVIMPGMSGRELSDLTGLNTLFMSGYTDQIIGAEGLLTSDVALLPKPFTAGELLTRVADALARVGSDSR